VVVTRWGSDPWTGGSYAVPRALGLGRAQKIYSETIQRRLFFAGEVAGEYSGTLQGAWDSGKKEAEKVLASISTAKL